jgi:hypothetical protein
MQVHIPTVQQWPFARKPINLNLCIPLLWCRADGTEDLAKASNQSPRPASCNPHDQEEMRALLTINARGKLAVDRTHED